MTPTYFFEGTKTMPACVTLPKTKVWSTITTHGSQSVLMALTVSGTSAELPSCVNRWFVHVHSIPSRLSKAPTTCGWPLKKGWLSYGNGTGKDILASTPTAVSGRPMELTWTFVVLSCDVLQQHIMSHWLLPHVSDRNMCLLDRSSKFWLK